MKYFRSSSNVFILRHNETNNNKTNLFVIRYDLKPHPNDWLSASRPVRCALWRSDDRLQRRRQAPPDKKSVLGPGPSSGTKLLADHTPPPHRVWAGENFLTKHIFFVHHLTFASLF